MTKILSDEELSQVLRNRFVTEDAARAIEAAVVAKLHAQGIDTSPERVEKTAKSKHGDVELPAPFGYVSDFKPAGYMTFRHERWRKGHMISHSTTPVFTHAQLRDAVLADRENRGGDAVREALEETQSLLAAMLHETRPVDEISAQIVANRAALSAQEGKQ